MTLLERGSFLESLTVLLGEAKTGRGQVALVSGEAGIGKTALVETFSQTQGSAVRVLAGACDSLTTPRPLGPWIDIAKVVGGQVEALIRGEGGQHDLFDAVLNDLTACPQSTVMILEDIHWADEATLDLLRWLSRRIPLTRTLLVATFRDDELAAAHPLRRFLGDTATSATVHRFVLPPLTERAVEELASDTDLDAGALYRLTGGNPFLVAELVAGSSVRIPETVRDAVLARMSRLSPESRDVLELAAVIGMRIEPTLLEDGADGVPADELLSAAIVHWEGDHLTFRHEITRAAVLGSIPPARRRRLNAQALALLTAVKAGREDYARLAHHAEEAGDHEAVLTYAVAAAHDAVALHAHREAASQYERALRSRASMSAEQRALLFEAHSYECSLTEQIMPAIESRQGALAIWRELGNRIKSGENLRWLSRLYWFAARHDDSLRAAFEAVETLESEPSGTQLGWAYSNISHIRMLEGDCSGAVEWGERALTIAERFGETELLVHALNNIGSARWMAGDEDGREQLEQSLLIAKEAGLHEHVARAYVNLANTATHTHEFELASAYLDAGVPYCIEHNIDSSRHHLLADRAMLRLHQGRWDQARDDAAAVIADPNCLPQPRLQALTVTGTIRARRADDDAWRPLDEALSLATAVGVYEWLSLVRLARTEAAFWGGDKAKAIREARVGLDLAAGRKDQWRLGQFAIWLQRVGASVGSLDQIVGPFALEMKGQLHAAVDRWSVLGYPFEAALALAHSDDETDLRCALQEFEKLEARAPASAVARSLRKLGVRGIPRGARSATRRNPANLTPRELEILGLVAGGLRDAEIAGRLFLSTKTVGHHVSAILRKLGVRSRAEAASLFNEGRLSQES